MKIKILQAINANVEGVDLVGETGNVYEIPMNKWPLVQRHLNECGIRHEISFDRIEKTAEVEPVLVENVDKMVDDMVKEIISKSKKKIKKIEKPKKKRGRKKKKK